MYVLHLCVNVCLNSKPFKFQTQIEILQIDQSVVLKLYCLMTTICSYTYVRPFSRVGCALSACTLFGSVKYFPPGRLWNSYIVRLEKKCIRAEKDWGVSG